MMKPIVLISRVRRWKSWRGCRSWRMITDLMCGFGTRRWTRIILIRKRLSSRSPNGVRYSPGCRAWMRCSCRECINPRPEDQAAIFRDALADTMGFLTYSEGCNDDVNKAIWSGLGWDPNTGLREILRQYIRYFIGEDYAEEFAQGLLELEQNW